MNSRKLGNVCLSHNFKRLITSSRSNKSVNNNTCHYQVHRRSIIPLSPTSSTYIQFQSYTSTSKYSNNDNNNPTGSDYHKLYQEQIQELEKERSELFGTSDDDNNDYDANNKSNTTSSPMDEMKKSIDEMNREREEIYNFSKEEKQAWGNMTASSTSNNSPTTTTTTSTVSDASNTTTHTNHPVNHKLSPELMNSIHQAREAKERYEAEIAKETESKVNEMIQNMNHPNNKEQQKEIVQEENNPIFTHLNKSGEEVSMVDVGDKTVSKRVAIARSSVWFPPEVMEAFGLEYDVDETDTATGVSQSSSSDVVGPKGPIFATARIAGIMGAKRTSDLIPLCHPLPLSKVHVDIKLQGDRAIIECECRVTHKTGVEMEALAGASIAALTIYDMVKAVSHNVRIESTFLVAKRGGKRDVSKQI